MRSFILGLVLLALPRYVAGQERDRPAEEKPDAAASSARGRWTDRPTLPPHPGSVPFPNVGPRPFPNLQHRGLLPPRVESEHRYRRPYRGPEVVFVPYASPVVIEREVVVERPAPSRLILDIHPTTAQIFADGFYIGTPEDVRFADGGAVLEPGPHRIDVLARDHESVSFDINLAHGQSATFRQRLTPIVSTPPPAPAATVETPPAVKPQTTFYLVPGCYMGNVPPKEANLPPTCDISRAVSFQY